MPRSIEFLLLLVSAYGREGDYTERAVGVAPGNPSVIRVAVINTAAESLSLVPTMSTLTNGVYKFPPPASVPQYGAAGSYNYGFEVSGSFSFSHSFVSDLKTTRLGRRRLRRSD
jgi:hypothetical protein